MRQVCLLLVLLKIVIIYGYPGETEMLLPPFEVRTMDGYHVPQQFQAYRSPQRPEQQILHSDVHQKSADWTKITERPRSENINEKIYEMRVPYKQQDSSQFRTAARTGPDGNDSAYHLYPSPFPHLSLPYGSTSNNQKAASVSISTAPAVPKLPLLKPDLPSLFKPTTTKVSSKMSGLLGLIPALFSGSSSDGLQMNGLKTLLIDGIVKPLLVAKGGLKSLISKLSIPLISLLLINLEVLITVWWLWEECEPPKSPVMSVPTYAYPKPAYNHNSYNSYR